MKKLKVAFLHNIISPYRIPLFEGLSSHPFIDLYVFFCADTHKIRKWDIIRSNSYNYEVLPGTALEFLNISYHINPSIISRLFRGEYDVVIISGSPDFTTHVTYITSKLLRIPTIWWSEGIESAQSYLGKLINPLTKHIIKNVDAVVVPGKLSKDFHMRLGANPEKIFLAPNIVNNNKLIAYSSKLKLDTNRVKKELNLTDKKIILCVGQLIKRKGVEYLIEAYTSLKNEQDNICLVVVGDGILKEKLKQKCNDLYLKDVIFTGWVSEDQKIMYYSVADLFVLPTLEDVWGLVINEAMCCGLPVISTKAAGATWDMIIPGENGYIIESKNVDELYSSIKRILFDEESKKRMSCKSLEIISNSFSLENMIHGFIFAIVYAVKRSSKVNKFPELL